MPTTARKRPADEWFGSKCKVPKRCHKSTPGSQSSRTQEESHVFTPQPHLGETDHQNSACIQMGKLVLEQFSLPAYQLHTTIGIINRDRIQFYHANHSVILVSSAIDIGINDKTGGLDKLIAIVITFSRLSLRDIGILHNPHDSSLSQGNRDLSIHNTNPGVVRFQEGGKLEFGGDDETGPFALTCGALISSESSLVGQLTTVLHATSPKWQDLNLVIKICWLETGRGSESEFLQKAIREAEYSTGKWALRHLPGLLFAQDVTFDSDSTQRRVASLFNNVDFVNGEYEYKGRLLQIIIQERLYPLTALTNAKDIAQVLLDVMCSAYFSLTSYLPHPHTDPAHRWLYEKVGVLHRDLSLDNIMY